MKRILLFYLVGVVLALSMAAYAIPASADEDLGPPISSDLLGAMYGDLGLTDEQARTLLTKQDQASDLEQALQKELGPAFAGAWFTPETGKLTVATTEVARTNVITARGANAVIVRYSAAQLDAVLSALDEKADQLPPGITGWYVDPTTNHVVVEGVLDIPVVQTGLASGESSWRCHRTNTLLRPLPRAIRGVIGQGRDHTARQSTNPHDGPQPAVGLYPAPATRP